MKSKREKNLDQKRKGLLTWSVFLFQNFLLNLALSVILSGSLETRSYAAEQFCPADRSATSGSQWHSSSDLSRFESAVTTLSAEEKKEATRILASIGVLDFSDTRRNDILNLIPFLSGSQTRVVEVPFEVAGEGNAQPVTEKIPIFGLSSVDFRSGSSYLKNLKIPSGGNVNEGIEFNIPSYTRRSVSELSLLSTLMSYSIFLERPRAGSSLLALVRQANSSEELVRLFVLTKYLSRVRADEAETILGGLESVSRAAPSLVPNISWAAISFLGEGLSRLPSQNRDNVFRLFSSLRALDGSLPNVYKEALTTLPVNSESMLSSYISGLSPIIDQENRGASAVAEYRNLYRDIILASLPRNSSLELGATLSEISGSTTKIEAFKFALERVSFINASKVTASSKLDLISKAIKQELVNSLELRVDNIRLSLLKIANTPPIPEAVITFPGVSSDLLKASSSPFDQNLYLLRPGTVAECSSLVSDNEGDSVAPEAIQYEWLRDGKIVGGGRSYTIGSMDVGKGVQCQVRVFANADSLGSPEVTASSIIKIQGTNSVPTVRSVIAFAVFNTAASNDGAIQTGTVNGTPRADKLFNTGVVGCSASGEDLDGDSLLYSYSFYDQRGAVIGTFNNRTATEVSLTLSPTMKISSGEEVYCEVSVRDSFATSSLRRGGSRVANRTPRSLSNNFLIIRDKNGATLSDNDPLFNDGSVICAPAFEDQDGDSLNYSFEWVSVKKARVLGAGEISSSGSRSTFNMNRTLEVGDSLICRVSVRDHSNSSTVQGQTAIIQNRPPKMKSLDITPAAPRVSGGTSDDIICRAVFEEPDGDDIINTYPNNIIFEWRKNGSALPLQNTKVTADSSRLSNPVSQVTTDDILTCTAYVKDSVGESSDQLTDSVVVNNNPPSIDSLSIVPKATSDTNSDTFLCSAQASDLERQPLRYSFSFFIDGVRVTSASFPLLTVSPQDSFAEIQLNPLVVRGGAELSCQVTVEDTRQSVKSNLASYEIKNRAPAVSRVIFSPASLEIGKTVACAPDATDPDGDPISYSFRWASGQKDLLGDVVSPDGSSSSLLLSGDRLKVGDPVSCFVTPRDALTSGPEFHGLSQISNRVPRINSVLVFPTGDIFNDQSAICSVSASDDDGQQIFYEFSWRVDGKGPLGQGVIQGSSSTISLGGFNVKPGDTVSCEVRVTDGQAYSDYTIRSRTIANRLPEVVGVNFQSSSSTGFFNDSVAACEVSSQDLDRDSLSVSFSWSILGGQSLGPGSSTSASRNQLDLNGRGLRVGDEIVCTVWVSDGISISRAVTRSRKIENRVPSVIDVEIASSAYPIFNTSKLTCTPIAVDLDGESLNLSFRWFLRNRGLELGQGTLIEGGRRSERLLSALIVPGDEVVCEVSASDRSSSSPLAQKSVIIDNNLPVVDSISLVSNDPIAYNSGSFTCSATVSDVDGNSPGVTFVFSSSDGIILGGGTPAVTGRSSTIILNRQFAPDKDLVCKAVVFDGVATVESQSATIDLVNRSPNIISPACSESATLGDFYECSVRAIDPDGDTLLLWSKSTSDSCGFLSANSPNTLGVTQVYTGVPVQIGSGLCDFMPVATDRLGSSSSPGLVQIQLGNEPPVVTGITPAWALPSGLSVGGTTRVVITGSGFTTTTQVRIGEDACTELIFVSQNQVSCKMPTLANLGEPLKSVTVKTDESFPRVLQNAFEYYIKPEIWSAQESKFYFNRSNTLVLHGAYLQNVGSVSLVPEPGLLVPDLSCGSIRKSGSSRIECSLSSISANAIGRYSVVVKNSTADTQESIPFQSIFFVYPPPSISAVAPSEIPLSGHIPLEITGTGFLNGVSIIIQDASGSSVSCPVVSSNATKINCFIPETAGMQSSTSDLRVTLLVSNPVSFYSQNQQEASSTFSASVYNGKRMKSLAMSASLSCGVSEVYTSSTGTFGGSLECFGERSLENGQVQLLTRPTQLFSVFGGRYVELVKSHPQADHICYTDILKDIYCFGKNNRGQVGSPEKVSHDIPKKLSSVVSVRMFALGSNHTCAISESGLPPQTRDNLFCWGDNSYGQIGLDHQAEYTSPALVHTFSEGEKVKSLFATSRSTCYTLESNPESIFCSGDNTNGMSFHDLGRTSDFVETALANEVLELEGVDSSGSTLVCARLAATLNDSIKCTGPMKLFADRTSQATSSDFVSVAVPQAASLVRNISVSPTGICLSGKIGATNEYRMFCRGEYALGSKGETSEQIIPGTELFLDWNTAQSALSGYQMGAGRVVTSSDVSCFIQDITANPTPAASQSLFRIPVYNGGIPFCQGSHLKGRLGIGEGGGSVTSSNKLLRTRPSAQNQ